jgi:hypothetical protein
MQAPTTILGSSLMAVSSASKYLIRPADDMRPLPSDFFLDMTLSYVNITFKYISVQEILAYFSIRATQAPVARVTRALVCQF